MNGQSVWLVSSFRSQRIARKPTAAAESMPQVAAATADWEPKISARCCQASSRPAAATAGSESKNEKRAAVRRSRPVSIPEAIVTPLREVPGIRASTCKSPIVRPSLKRTPAKPSRPNCPCRARHQQTPSATPKSTVAKNIAAAITPNSLASPRIRCLAANPTITIGSVPTPTMIAVRDSTVPSGRPV